MPAPKYDAASAASKRIATKLQQWPEFVRLVDQERSISEDLRKLLEKAKAVTERPSE